MKHFLEHTKIGLCAICDDEPRPVRELTSNPQLVTCEKCWGFLTETTEAVLSGDITS